MCGWGLLLLLLLLALVLALAVRLLLRLDYLLECQGEAHNVRAVLLLEWVLRTNRSWGAAGMGERDIMEQRWYHAG